MKRIAGLAYGLGGYVAFNAVVMYLVGFMGNFLVPVSVDAGPAASTGAAIAVDLVLLLGFALPHSIMARPGFKAWWTRIVAPDLERSTYIWISSALLAVLICLWRPIPAVVWQVDAAWARILLWSLFGIGWAMAMAATFQTDHFELLGVRQALAWFSGREYRPAPFGERGLYRWIRHPIMLGQLLGFWATPTMTAGHLLFALVMLAYVLVALRYEERDLLAMHGDTYRAYRDRTGKLLPHPSAKRLGL